VVWRRLRFGNIAKFPLESDGRMRARLALMLLVVLPAAAVADERIDRGRQIVEESCSRCHAVGVDGDSPLAAAPLFRTLGQRFRIADLEEALAEGITTGHPEMPEFAFAADDVSAIIAYLQSIQVP
jgi:mono/diheme cytochrome c family protein